MLTIPRLETVETKYASADHSSFSKAFVDNQGRSYDKAEDQAEDKVILGVYIKLWIFYITLYYPNTKLASNILTNHTVKHEGHVGYKSCNS